VKAKVLVNTGIVFVSAMVIFSAWLFETVTALGGGCMLKFADHQGHLGLMDLRRVFHDRLWIVDTHPS